MSGIKQPTKTICVLFYKEVKKKKVTKNIYSLYIPHYCHYLSKIQIWWLFPLLKSQQLPSTYKAKFKLLGRAHTVSHVDLSSLIPYCFFLEHSASNQLLRHIYMVLPCSLLSPICLWTHLLHKFALSFQVQLNTSFPRASLTFSAACAVIKLLLTPRHNCLPISLTKLIPAPNLMSEHHWYSISICSIKQYILTTNILLLTSIRKINCTLKLMVKGSNRSSITQLQSLGQWSAKQGILQGSTNDGPPAKSSPQLVSVNEILLKTAMLICLIYCLWLFLPYNSRVE